MASARPVGRLLPALLLIVSSTAGADALDDILERGSIRVGVAEFVPWTMRSESGDLIGFEIDVANKIAEDMGVTAEFEVYVWEDIIAALRGGEIDIIAGGMSITPERALQVNFTRPIADSGVSLATNTEKTKDIERLEELNDEDIILTVVADTLALDVSQTLFGNASINVFPTHDLAEKNVVEGRAHAYVATLPEVQFLALKHPGKIDLPISEPLIASREALAVRKGEQELLNFLDAWVTARQADKWVPTTRDYWFNTLDWVEQTD